MAQKAAKIESGMLWLSSIVLRRRSSFSIFPHFHLGTGQISRFETPKPALHSIALRSDQSGQTFDLSPGSKPPWFTRLPKW